MNKKSLNCVESEISSSRTELSNSAIQDIIATNNVILGKESHRGRCSRACKAVIFMIIFGFIVLGIIALTLVLANSRNRYLAWVNRLNDEKLIEHFNATHRLYVQHENLTRDFGQKEVNDVSSEDKVEYRPTTTTTTIVILTSDHFEGETTKMANLHRSSLIMHTKEMNDEDFSSQTLSIKPYPSSNTITNEPSTSSTTSTTVQTSTATTTQTTGRPSSQRTKTVITIDNEVRTTEANRLTTEGEFVTNANNYQSDESLTSTMDISTTSTIPIDENEQTSTVKTDGLFTTFFSNHFDLETSTTTTTKTTKKQRQKLSRLHQTVDDFIDDLVFS